MQKENFKKNKMKSESKAQQLQTSSRTNNSLRFIHSSAKDIISVQARKHF